MSIFSELKTGIKGFAATTSGILLGFCGWVFLWSFFGGDERLVNEVSSNLFCSSGVVLKVVPESAVVGRGSAEYV